MVPIIEGAGGVMTDWTGSTLHWLVHEHADATHAWSAEVLAACVTNIHAHALEVLNLM